MTSDQSVTPDTLSRVVKMAIDTGEVATVEEGYALFTRYRLGVVVDGNAARSAAHQAALLTIINTGRRALLGGVLIAGQLDVPLLVDLPGGYPTLALAACALGAALVDTLPCDIPTLILGRPPAGLPPIALRVTFGGWKGGVIPADEDRALDEDADAILPAILAGALGVSEVFQNLRGNPLAAQRSVGISLWHPEMLDWEAAPPGPSDFVAPSRLWLIGLGHLGQAYLWLLGLLPYCVPSEVELTLQDFDDLTLSNDSTSVLTTAAQVGEAKTRAMAKWVEARGFRTRLVERRFAGDVALQDDDPRVALCGVDNLAARAALEDAGFDLVVESGLGAGPMEYLAMRLHVFPSSMRARARWAESGVDAVAAAGRAAAYARLAEDGVDDCGLVQLASRTVGAPFVGVVAAALVVSEVIRRLNGVTGCDVIDLTLRDIRLRQVVPSAQGLRGFNPGFAELKRGGGINQAALASSVSIHP